MSVKFIWVILKEILPLVRWLLVMQFYMYLHFQTPKTITQSKEEGKNHFALKYRGKTRCGSRIWSRGAQLLTPKVADVEAELHEQSKLSVAEVQGPLKGPGSFWVFNA